MIGHERQDAPLVISEEAFLASESVQEEDNELIEAIREAEQVANRPKSEAREDEAQEREGSQQEDSAISNIATMNKNEVDFTSQRLKEGDSAPEPSYLAYQKEGHHLQIKHHEPSTNTTSLKDMRTIAMILNEDDRLAKSAQKENTKIPDTVHDHVPLPKIVNNRQKGLPEKFYISRKLPGGTSGPGAFSSSPGKAEDEIEVNERRDYEDDEETGLLDDRAAKIIEAVLVRDNANSTADVMHDNAATVVNANSYQDSTLPVPVPVPVEAVEATNVGLREMFRSKGLQYLAIVMVCFFSVLVAMIVTLVVLLRDDGQLLSESNQTIASPTPTSSPPVTIINNSTVAPSSDVLSDTPIFNVTIPPSVANINIEPEDPRGVLELPTYTLAALQDPDSPQSKANRSCNSILVSVTCHLGNWSNNLPL